MAQNALTANDALFSTTYLDFNEEYVNERSLTLTLRSLDSMAHNMPVNNHFEDVSAYFTENPQLEGDTRMYDDADVVSAMLDSSFPLQPYQHTADSRFQEPAPQYPVQNPGQQQEGFPIQQYSQHQYQPQKNPQHFIPQVSVSTGIDPSVDRNELVIKQEKKLPQFHIPVARAPTPAQKKPADNLANDQKYFLQILGIPEKSRVETQMKMCLKLSQKPGTLTPPNWNKLKIDPLLLGPQSAKKKAPAKKKSNAPSNPSSSLILKAQVVRSSVPSQSVLRCYGCVQREFRTQERKAKRRKTSENSSTKKNEGGENEGGVSPDVGVEDERKKILQMYCEPEIDFSQLEVIIPTRITCYCRHHKESAGFLIQIFLYDQSTMQLVCSASSNCVVITDDHKSSKKREREEGISYPATPMSQTPVPATPIPQTPIPQTPIPQTPDPHQHQFPFSFPLLSEYASSLTNPFSSLFSSSPATPTTPLPPSTPLPPTSTIPSHTIHQTQSPLPLSPPSSTPSPPPPSSHSPHPSSAHSPPSSHSPHFPSSVHSPPPSSPPSDAPPLIQRLIPTEGPTSGGIEVTVLGKNFRPGLTTFFGSSASTKTQFWGDSTLVSTLPPSLAAGPVVVTLTEPRISGNSTSVTVVSSNSSIHNNNIIFTYTQNVDRHLLELALQVIGLKLSGKIENPSQIARKIVEENHSAFQGLNFAMQQQQGDQPQQSPDLKTLILTSIYHSLSLKSPFPLNLFLPFSQTGQTLLHLSVLADFDAVVDVLIDFCLINEESENLDIMDNNGNTALHIAAIFNRESIAQKLLAAGASLKINNEAGDLPADLATTNTMKILLKPPPDPPVNSDINAEVPTENVSEPESEPPANRDEHVIQFLPEEIRMMSDQFSEEKNLRKKMEMLWLLVVAFLSHFWKEYRAFLYIGMLAATGGWTLMDYIPTILGIGTPSPTVVYPKGVNVLTTPCNPPTLGCLPSGTYEGGITFPANDGFLHASGASRSLKVPAVLSVESYLLNFGQFSIFVLALFLVVYHFKEKLENCKFWSLILAIFGVLVVGSLFIFDII